MRSFLFIACSSMLYLAAGCTGEQAQQPDSPPETPQVQQPATKPQPALPALPPLVDAKLLEALVPEEVGAWKRIELRSMEFETGEGRMVQTSAAFQISQEPTLIHIQLLDTRKGKNAQSVFHVSHANPAPGNEVFEVAGQPATEQWGMRPVHSILTVLCADRYLLIVSAEGTERKTARMILDAIDVKALAALK